MVTTIYIYILILGDGELNVYVDGELTVTDTQAAGT